MASYPSFPLSKPEQGEYSGALETGDAALITLIQVKSCEFQLLALFRDLRNGKNVICGQSGVSDGRKHNENTRTMQFVARDLRHIFDNIW